MSKSNLDQISERLKGLKKPAKPAEERIKNIKKQDGRKNNGGRPGMGRKSLEQDDRRLTLKRSWEHFAQEEEEVMVTRLEKGTRVQRAEKMQRVRVIQEKVYAAAKAGDINAAKEFNNRVLGHPKQPIVGDDDEAPIRADLGAGRILGTAYGEDESP